MQHEVFTGRVLSCFALEWLKSGDFSCFFQNSLFSEGFRHVSQFLNLVKNGFVGF